MADHFKPLKAAVAEVDGQPPALDAAVVALTALSNVLQTVDRQSRSAGGDQEAGRACRTDRRRRQAGADPARSDRRLARRHRRRHQRPDRKSRHLGTQRDLARRHPAVLPGGAQQPLPVHPESAIDVNVRDFGRLFGPGGMIDAFINDHLISYVDTASAAVEVARRFRAGCVRARRVRTGAADPRRSFPGGSGPGDELHA